MLWALTDPVLTARAGEAGTHGTAWPHRAQVCRVERQRVHVDTGLIQRAVSYAVTSRAPERAAAARVLATLRGPGALWARIENTRHWVRDVTCDEDRAQLRSGAAPHATAACRNLALALLRRAGHPTLAAATRTDAGRPRAAIALVATAGLKMMK